MTIRVEQGDCRDVLATLDADSLDACVTDPPYHLGAPQGRSSRAPEGMYATMRTGFMGKEWDGGDVAFDPDTWRAVLRVLKPGAHLLAFGGTRTAHRMTCAIEDAGFEVRDTLCWLYGSGFPKSLDVSKAIDKAAGAEREVVGKRRADDIRGGNRACNGDRATHTIDITTPATPDAQRWTGWGTALKPAYEPIILARKPFRGTVAANVLAHGTGAINVDACRVGTDTIAQHGRTGDGFGFTTPEEADRAWIGRWPANVAHDGSGEVEAAFAAFGERPSTETNANGRDYASGAQTDSALFGRCKQGQLYADTGSASRFFYAAKADSADRADSRHPTVKPVDLMRWLVRLITPPGGTVLDPFAGSGTTGEAAMLEKCDAILIEADAKHAADIRHRIDRWSGLDAPLFAGNTP